MKYLLDTCVISDFIKGEKNTIARIQNTVPAEIAVSTITVMEIQYGLELNPRNTKLIRSVIDDFLKLINILKFTADDANEAAIVRATLKQQGRPIGSYDVLLAGTALSQQLILVTANVKEFNRVAGLMLENWRVQ